MGHPVQEKATRRFVLPCRGDPKMSTLTSQSGHSSPQAHLPWLAVAGGASRSAAATEHHQNDQRLRHLDTPAMPAVAAPRPASVTPRNTPVKGVSSGSTNSNSARTRPRSAVHPSTASPKTMRALSPALLSASSSSDSASNHLLGPNRDWELDRIRRLMYEQVGN